MTVPESFPAFLATQRDDAVDRGVTTLARDDLGDGEVTVRVDWSSVNYKDALATIPKGQVARISPLVPGIDCCAMRAKSPMTRCIDENAGPPEAIMPCIALTRFCACSKSGIIAMTAFASFAPGTPAI